MAETATAKKAGSRSTKIGRVTSTKMSKTIVVQVIMKKAHPLYRRVVAKSKSFTRTMRKTRRTWATPSRLKRRGPCPS